MVIIHHHPKQDKTKEKQMLAGQFVNVLVAQDTKLGLLQGEEHCCPSQGTQDPGLVGTSRLLSLLVHRSLPFT